MGRRWIVCLWTLCFCLLLSCCGGAEVSQAEQLALDIRGEYLEGAGCDAELTVTADYGQRVYTYTMEAAFRQEGESLFTLTAPEEVAGVTARLKEGESALEFDGVRVETGPLEQTGMSPLEAIPALLEAACGGYIAACGLETLEDGAEALRVDCRDPELPPGEGLEYALWFDPDSHALLRGELSQDGFTVLQCQFARFQLLKETA